MNDLTEKEQLDELKAWWRENRAMILGGVALGIAAIAGFRMYTAGQVESALEASTQYEALVREVGENDLEPAQDIAATIFDEYAGTVYADQARLAMARLYMDAGRDADAADVLRPLATAGGSRPIEHVARLRLARIMLYQDRPQDALDLLGEPADTAFAARYNDVIGDAHHALGNMDAAASAWTAALADATGSQTVDAEFLRMKLDDLPAPDGEPEPEAPAPGENAADDASAGAASEETE